MARLFETMIPLILYYLVLPFLVFAVLLRLMRAYGSDDRPKEILDFYSAHPIEPKQFRALRLDGKPGRGPVALTHLGDFESQQEAVDAAFAAKSASQGSDSSFLVL